MNVDVTVLLAGLAVEHSFRFLFLGSGFDGRKGHYAETDRGESAAPFGETKAAPSKSF